MAKTVTLPFPSGGLNARDPLDAMPATDAWEMRNILPRSGYGEFVGDGVIFHDAAGSGGDVKTAITAAYLGSEKLFVCYGGKIVLVLTSSTETDLKTGQTVDNWQHAFINNTLVMVNGADQPQQISSVPAISDAVYTIIADDNKLVDVTVYQSRLYFIEKDTTKMWYGATNATTGALTAFDLATVIKKGGTLEWISSWTESTGSGLQDYLVIMTSQGEMLVYAGDDPAANFYLVGRFYVGKPLSRRGKENIGADLWFLTRDGMLSAADVMRGNGNAGKYKALTDKIQNVYRDRVTTYGSAVGWEIFNYPRGNLVLINIPPTVDLSGNGDYGWQYVMNTETGAWCELFIMYPAWTWTLFAETAVYGGKAHTARAFNPTGVFATVGDGIYLARVSWAYNDLGARGFDKHVQMIRPTISDFSDFDSGFGTLATNVGVYGELGTTPGGGLVSIGTFTAAGGNVNRWVGATTYSKLISPAMSFTVTSINARINNVQLMYEPATEPF